MQADISFPISDRPKNYRGDLDAEREQMETAILHDYCRDAPRALVEKVLFLHRDQGFWAAMVAAYVMDTAYHKRIW